MPPGVDRLCGAGRVPAGVVAGVRVAGKARETVAGSSGQYSVVSTAAVLPPWAGGFVACA